MEIFRLFQYFFFQFNPNFRICSFSKNSSTKKKKEIISFLPLPRFHYFSFFFFLSSQWRKIIEPVTGIRFINGSKRTFDLDQNGSINSSFHPLVETLLCSFDRSSSHFQQKQLFPLSDSVWKNDSSNGERSTNEIVFTWPRYTNQRILFLNGKRIDCCSERMVISLIKFYEISIFRIHSRLKSRRKRIKQFFFIDIF